MLFCVRPRHESTDTTLTLDANSRVHHSHHEAEQRRQRMSGFPADRFCVYGVQATTEDTYVSDDGLMRIKRDCVIFETAAIYAISTIRLVPESEQITTWHINPSEVARLANFAMPGQAEPTDTVETMQRLIRGLIGRTDGLEPDQLRCVFEGFRTKLEDAQILVLKNSGDMSDSGWCQYAVVEELCEGMIPDSLGQNRRFFYHWKDRYERITTPPPEFKDDVRLSYYGG